MQEQSSAKRPFARRNFLATSLKASAAPFTTGLLSKQRTNAQNQYNVLFIIVDDLSPLLEAMDIQKYTRLTLIGLPGMVILK